MDYHEHEKNRMNIEGDRLSNLPDDLIHKILSYVGIKQAIETSVLSSRWRKVWTSMPYLKFSSDDFNTLPKFSKFVKHYLSKRNNETDVSSVEITFNGKVSRAFAKRFFDYACSHNVQELDIWCLRGGRIDFPPSLFSSQSLKHLTFADELTIMTPHTWNLSALVTLKLVCVTLSDDSTTGKGDGLFSNLANLKNLTLVNCTMMDQKCLNICHPGLSSLALECGCMDANVVTPQLKSLTINDWRWKCLISAPNLSSFHYRDSRYTMDFSSDFHCLENVDICISFPLDDKENAHKIVCLLQQFHSVKFLTLNSEMIKLLSDYVELISHQPSPFANLKSLKIYPYVVTPISDRFSHEVTMSNLCAEVKNYLLDSSPGANFTIVSREEKKAVNNTESARRLMRELQRLLDQWKEKSGTSSAHIKRGKAPMVSHMATMHEQGESDTHFDEKITHIESYWERLNEQVEKGYKNMSQTISMLRRIQELLKKVPRDDQDKLEARFSGLRAEAEIIMDNVMNRMKNQFAN